MNELKIDWNQRRPTAQEITDLWKTIKFIPLNNWSEAALKLKSKLNETHSNGGAQFHKFKVESNLHFDWFSSRNRLDEIKFVRKAIRHDDLNEYRINLKIKENKPKVELVNYWTDIYDVPSILARTLAVGGAYKSINPQEAWKIGVDFVENEFENRFDEFNCFQFVVKSAEWFFDIAWDFSIAIFDVRKNELYLIDITDTD
ncbi:hypothetical protein [Flagellimonas sp. 2504JD4-2]